MKERVLITGASGFVGYHLIEEALQNNLEVFIAIRKSSKTDHLKNFDIQYVYPEFNNQEALKTLLAEIKPDYIIHAAGVTSARSEGEYNRINATYTYNLASAAKEACPALKKFVLVGSLAAVGPLDTLNGWITETTTPKPVTAYGRSKLLAEQKLKTVAGLNYTILRPTAVYGPRDTGIFIFFKQVVKGIEPYIGSAQQKLSFIYVKDLAKACVKALYGGNNQTFNLSDGNFYSRYELGNITKEVLKLKTLKFHLPVNFVKIIAAVSEKLSSLRNKAAILNIEKLNELTATNWHCDIEAAKSDLGFYPLYNLQAGMAETLKWYKAHKWL
ncbi:NAD-dependent epimerase/dehydratase family protein [Mucilaginibacter celer]|uniref:NAD-dependent epimerase/dehydratase family protein n=1 Tax=Mucilaginibacter celer TaxID=2305508 RepID=A0A494VTE2_9SPHI|nr:NAD(P)-dependent oxidoreductase [Mucilaginibacter celer]AYL94625.1 NAD-dependent epimerase/dehydratase family protein [Mucilaginibacter celer]